MKTKPHLGLILLHSQLLGDFTVYYMNLVEQEYIELYFNLLTPTYFNFFFFTFFYFIFILFFYFIFLLYFLFFYFFFPYIFFYFYILNNASHERMSTFSSRACVIWMRCQFSRLNMFTVGILFTSIFSLIFHPKKMLHSK